MTEMCKKDLAKNKRVAEAATSDAICLAANLFFGITGNFESEKVRLLIESEFSNSSNVTEKLVASMSTDTQLFPFNVFLCVFLNKCGSNVALEC